MLPKQENARHYNCRCLVVDADKIYNKYFEQNAKRIVDEAIKRMMQS